MKNTNLPTWVQPLLIALGTTTFSIFMTIGIQKMSALNATINRFNVINAHIYGKLDVVHTEIQTLKEFKVKTEQENHERDKTVVQLEQQVGILEEKVKVRFKQK